MNPHNRLKDILRRMTEAKLIETWTTEDRDEKWYFVTMTVSPTSVLYPGLKLSISHDGDAMRMDYSQGTKFPQRKQLHGLWLEFYETFMKIHEKKKPGRRRFRD